MGNPEVSETRIKSKVFELFKRKAAPVKHFTPVDFSDGVPRDRFGNRIISSITGLAYLDRNEDPVRAAVLVSREGEGFLRENKGLLKPIEQAIVNSEIIDFTGGKRIPYLGLGGERRIKRAYDKDGNQSKIFFLETEKEKVVVKKIQPTPIYTDSLINQPYFNEMLQVQAVSHDVGKKLADAGLYMPKFLFATGQVCAVRFEDGFHPNYSEVENRLLTALDVTKSYVSEQVSKGNPVWDNVYLDEQVRIDKDTSNFIQKKDASLVWIDPFVYFPPGPERASPLNQIDFSEVF